jgi:hypothetical protein
MPLDSKQHIINDLISVLEYFPGSDPKNISPIIYEYAEPVSNEKEYFAIADVISSRKIIDMIRLYSSPLIGINPNSSSTFTFYCKLDGYKYPRSSLKAIIRRDDNIMEEHQMSGYRHFRTIDPYNVQVSLEIRTELYHYKIIYDVNRYTQSYLSVLKFDGRNVNERYDIYSPYFKVKIVK